jgi:hypothetical protein
LYVPPDNRGLRLLLLLLLLLRLIRQGQVLAQSLPRCFRLLRRTCVCAVALPTLLGSPLCFLLHGC